MRRESVQISVCRGVVALKPAQHTEIVQRRFQCVPAHLPGLADDAQGLQQEFLRFIELPRVHVDQCEFVEPELH